MKYSELRFYCFTNFYLSSIQQGIQTGHASVRLLRKYQYATNDTQPVIDRQSRSMVEDWADNHETYIVLNGGASVDLDTAYKLAETSGFPYVEFNEPGCGGLRTAVGILLPDTIFNMQREYLRDDTKMPGTVIYRHKDGSVIDPDHKLYSFMEYFKSCGLAR